MKEVNRFSQRALSLLLAAVFCAALLPWAAVPAEATAASSEVTYLNGIPYLGDASKCAMSREQAAAYAKLLMDGIAGDIPLFTDNYSVGVSVVEEPSSWLQSFYSFGYEGYYENNRCNAILCDLEGNGVPYLLLLGDGGHYWNYPFHLFGWHNGQVQRLIEEEYVYRGGTAIGKNASGTYSAMYSNYEGAGADHYYTIYQFKDGTMSKAHQISSGYYWETGNFAITKDGIVVATYDFDQEKELYQRLNQVLLDAGGIAADDFGYSDSTALFSELSGYSCSLLEMAVGLNSSAGVRTTPAELLDLVPYHYGDTSACRMTPEQALALAEKLEGQIADDKAAHNSRFPNNFSEYGDEMLFGSYAALFDTGTGVPAVFYVSNSLIENVSENLYGPGLQGFWSGLGIGSPAIFQYVNGNVEEAAAVGYIYNDRLVSAGGGAWGRIAVYPYVNGVISSVSSTTGYFPPEDSYYEIDGRQVSAAEYESWRAEWYGDGDTPVGYSYGGGVGGWFWGVGSAEAVAAVLRAYAEAAKTPVYTYPQAGESDAHYRDVAQAVSGRGVVEAVYRLLDDLYYVLLENQGAYSGAVVRGVTRNGRPTWEIYQTDEEPAEESALESLLNRLLSSSNLTLDFGKLRGSPTVGDLADYLRELLENYDGLSPNDAAKTELAAFLDSAVPAVASDSASGRDNRLTLDSALVSDLASTARSVWADLLAALNSSGVALNKTVTPRARLLWRDVDLDQACQLTVDESLVSGLNGADLQVLLGGATRYIQLSDQSLRQLTGDLETFSIQFSQTGSNTYSISFLDEDGQVLDSLPSPIILGLPASSMTSTVMVSYTGGSDNWGGQYDAASGVLAFETRYSGQYEVLENNIQIDDITDLSEESQAAIRFLVSKGYLTLDENGLFNPQLPLTRYDFTRTLVSMFFALDRSLSTSFTDVPEESEYYDYIASAQANHLVEGITADVIFGGEYILSVEQMLTVTGRTLAEQKGYTVPEDAEQYLSAFEDGGSVSDWAQLHTALSVREGLKDRGGILAPQSDTTREQAAVVLYRLFLRLYEVPPVALDLPPESAAEESQSPFSAPVIFAAAAAGAVVVAAGAGVAVVIIRKRKAAA